MKSQKAYLVFVSAAAALGGLLFGYDTGIIAGAARFLKGRFQLSSLQEGWTVGVVLVGCIVGTAIAGVVSDRIGRRRFMMVTSFLFLFSALGCALPRSIEVFYLFRFLAGIAIGSASILSPLYISEISPAAKRGALVSVNQMAIVSGILLSYLVSWIFAANEATGWRWMFAAGSLPALLFFAMLLLVPESPRWLVKQGREGEAQAVLARVNTPQDAAAEISAIRQALSLEQGGLKELLQPGFRTALYIGLVLAVFQQITGINSIIYYAPRIFESAGFGRVSAIGQSAIVGVVNVLFTVVAILLVDRIGRKPMLLAAVLGMECSLVLLGAAFRFQLFSPHWVLVLTLLYIAFFAMAMGPIVWVVISEIFPTRVRGRAMAICTAALWLADFAVTLTFPVIADRLSETVAFWIYAAMCQVMFLFMLFALPETRGRSLEEIERRWLERSKRAG